MQLYIHIPFCKRICSYCDFYHITCFDQYSAFIEKLKKEIISQGNSQILDTIYFGGGTPSVLHHNDIKDIMNCIRENFDTRNVKEVTIECNPDDLNDKYCDTLLEADFNRISIGIQSFHDSHLKIMNRRHNAEEAISAVKSAKKAGFRNITVDLIYGLPFMTESQWQYNLDTVAELDVQHISAYHLTIEEGTIFDRQHMQPVSDDISELHYKMLRDNLNKNGFEQYEISNFCRKGFESIHNSGYWNGVPYLGLGPSAHSFDGLNKRWWQPSDLKRWLSSENPEVEILSEEQRNEEILMTSLRRVKGLKTKDSNLLITSDRFIRQSIMEYQDGYLRIKPEHFLISDYIISELI